MKTGFKDRFGKDICVGNKLKPVQNDYESTRISTVVLKNGEFYVYIPNYEPLYPEDLQLANYLSDGKMNGWEFEIIE